MNSPKSAFKTYTPKLDRKKTIVSSPKKNTPRSPKKSESNSPNIIKKLILPTERTSIRSPKMQLKYMLNFPKEAENTSSIKKNEELLKENETYSDDENLNRYPMEPSEVKVNIYTPKKHSCLSIFTGDTRLPIEDRNRLISFNRPDELLKKRRVRSASCSTSLRLIKNNILNRNCILRYGYV